MVTGKWLQPRHGSVAVFEKDYSQVQSASLDVYCPGCKDYLRLNRKSPAGKIAGWCVRCNRGVCP